RTFRETRRLATEQFNQQQLILAQSAARGVESYFKELSIGLQSLARMSQFQQMDPKCLQCMEHTYWGFPTRTSLRLLDKDGVLRFIYPNHDWRKDLIGRSYSEDAFFRETAKNGRTGVHVITNERGETRIRVAVAIYSTPETEAIKGTGVTTTQPSPIKPDPDRFCGVLVGSIDPGLIGRNLIRPIVSGKTGYAWLLDDRGVFLSHYEKGFVGHNAFEARSERNPDISHKAINQIQRKMLAGQEGLGRYFAAHNRGKGKEGQVEKLIAYAPVRIDNKVWSVAVCAPVSEVEEVIRASKRFELYTLGFVIFVLVEGGVLLLAISSRWARRLAHQVQIRTRELKETSDYLTNLIKYANAPIIVWDPDRKIAIFNKAFEQMSGRHEAEMLEGSLDALFPSESRSESLRKIESTAKGQFWDNVEIPILHKDGQVRVGLWNSANIYSEDAETLVATVAQGQDITERKRAEEYLRKSEERFRAIFETAQDSIFIKDRELRYVQVNPAMEGLFDLPESELVGKTDAELFGEEAGRHVAEMDSRVLAGEIIEEEDTKPVCGSPHTFHVVKVPMRDSSGEIIGLCGIARDVTARKQAEESLQESQRKFATMAENVPGILFRAIVHKDGSITLPYISPSARKFGLYGAEEMSVQPELLQVVIHPDYLEQFKEMTVAASGKLEPIDWEVRLNTQFTKIEFIRVIARPQAMADGDVAWDGLALDITERKQAEESLRQSEKQYRAVFESAADALLIFDFEGTIVEANPAACATYGYSYDEMIGLSGKDIVHPEYYHLFDNFKKQVKATGQFFAESVDVRKDGSAFDIEIRGTSFTFKGKDHLMALVRDISERKEAEKALRENERRLRLILENTSDGINIAEYDPKTHLRRLVMCNDCYVEMSGRSREELMATDDLNRFAHELECYSQPFHEQTLKGLPSMGMSCWNRPDGKENYYEWIATPHKVGDKYHIIGIDRDITDRKRAEEEKAELQEQLRQAVKMEAIGRLAGGIAHDFNNMLAIIQGYADLLLKAMDADDRNRNDVERIRTASKRAAALTRQLLAFGRRQAIKPEVLDLNEILADTDSMLQRIIGEDIELVTKPGEDLWRVRVDPRQIEEQVILNLAVNAREAMLGGGKLTIATANIVLDEEYAVRHTEVTPGEYVMLVVNDTGTGMSEEIMSHVFEPFFSTKQSDKSSGLGLSTIYGIIKQSGGHIEVESTLGQGSTFRMYLPRAKKPIKSTTAESEPDQSGQGTEIILVAEDEPLVRDLLCRILRETGYTVLVAADGKEAINAATNEGKIHLLVTDVVMPHMSGKELSDQIQGEHPDIKVLFVSGYTDNAISHHGILNKGVNFLAKPFTSVQLIRTVRRVLDGD
ncbi:MAG: PAS domain S-box protein, partial [Phycisphaerae bacterium]|nr:PAS domain S-box protein [Phycisphaerae bacterium]